MKNLIVNYQNLPQEVIQEIDTTYPHGYDHETFEFVNRKKGEIHTALRFSSEDVTYLIKLDTRKIQLSELDQDA